MNELAIVIGTPVGLAAITAATAAVAATRDASSRRWRQASLSLLSLFTLAFAAFTYGPWGSAPRPSPRPEDVSLLGLWALGLALPTLLCTHVVWEANRQGSRLSTQFLIGLIVGTVIFGTGLFAGVSLVLTNAT